MHPSQHTGCDSGSRGPRDVGRRTRSLRSGAFSSSTVQRRSLGAGRGGSHAGGRDRWRGGRPLRRHAGGQGGLRGHRAGARSGTAARGSTAGLGRLGAPRREPVPPAALLRPRVPPTPGGRAAPRRRGARRGGRASLQRGGDGPRIADRRPPPRRRRLHRPDRPAAGGRGSPGCGCCGDAQRDGTARRRRRRARRRALGERDPARHRRSPRRRGGGAGRPRGGRLRASVTAAALAGGAGCPAADRGGRGLRLRVLRPPLPLGRRLDPRRARRPAAGDRLRVGADAPR